MEKKIIKLSEDGDPTRISQLVSTMGAPEIEHLIETCILKCRGDPITLLKALLSDQTQTDSATVRKQDVFKFCITLMEKNDINNKLASDVLGLLLLEIDKFSPVALAALASFYVDSFQSGSAHNDKSLELFPKLLSAITAHENISYKGNSMKGIDYKGHIVNKVCCGKWAPQVAIQLTAMFRDVPLTGEELKFVMDKALRSFISLDLQDTPTMVYQMLLLAAKGQKKKALEGIICHFIDADKNYTKKTTNEFSDDVMECDDSFESLRHTEGTCILHIYFAIKQDQELGREFVKLLKYGPFACEMETVLAPFTLALTLSVARIHRMQDQLFDFLKTAIVKSFKDCEKQQQSRWLCEIIATRCDIQDSVLETIQNSIYGWDHVVQGLVQLGFILMDSFSPRAPFGRTDSVAPQPIISQSVCKLGAKTLLNTFKAHQVAHMEIIDQVFNRVITKATSSMSHYLDLLADAVKSAPEILLESGAKVRESFDYLSFLNPDSAEGLMTAIYPLLKLSMSLKDALILVLRKAMFSRQLTSRKIGVKGFLMMMQHFKISGGLPSSQSSQPFSSSQVHVHISKNSSSSNEGLCLEILGNLRRCLTQQADVRLLLYQGLFDVMAMNSKLQEPILELLLAQVKLYYENDLNVNPPLKLELCTSAQGDNVYLTEPFAHLLYCIQLCLAQSQKIVSGSEHDEDSEGMEVHKKLEHIMASLITRMIESELEDFELDKSANFSLIDSVGIKNNIVAILVSGTYEVLIEYCLLSKNHSNESCEQVLKMFDFHSKIAKMQEKTAAGVGKKGKPQGKMSMLSLGFVTSLLQKLLAVTADTNLEPLQTNSDFVLYLVNVALQKLQQVQVRGVCDGVHGNNKRKIIECCCTLSKIFYRYYVGNQDPEIGKKGRGENLLLMCLEALEKILNLIKQRFPDQLSTCLCQIDNVQGNESTDHEELASGHIKNFQRLVMKIFSVAEDERNLKGITSLLNIINLLTQTMPSSGSQIEQVFEWVRNLCKEQTVDDISTAKLLLSTLLAMNQKLSGNMTLLRDLSQDIHSKIGDIDQEVDLEESTHFGLISQRIAAPTALLLILQNLENELGDTEWAINRLKDYRDGQKLGDDLTQREDSEKMICVRLGIMINAFHELVQSSIPVGVCIEALFKQVTKLYGTLTLLTRFYLAMYSQGNGCLSSRYEKLIKLSGTNLTSYCYSMVTYVQTCENDKHQQAADKAKKNKKKMDVAVQADKLRVLKQSKNIPNLIFAIEQYEKYLIQLSKKSKMNLMEHMRLGTSRDFRINAAVVQSQSDTGSSSDDEGDDDDDKNDQNRSEADSSSSEENREAIAEVPAKKSKLGMKRVAGVLKNKN